MLGLVITSFIDMIEKQEGLSVLDTVMEGQSSTFTDYEYYDDAVFDQVIAKYSDVHDIDTSEALLRCGFYLFSYLMTIHPHFKQRYRTFKDVFTNYETEIFPLLNGMYEQQAAPSIWVAEQTHNAITLMFQPRTNHFQIMEGIILGAANYYKQAIEHKINYRVRPIEIHIQWSDV